MSEIIKKEKFSTLIIDGNIIDINKLSEKELEDLQKKLEDKEKRLRNQIDKMLES